MFVYMGIDPGVGGGLAWLQVSNSETELYYAATPRLETEACIGAEFEYLVESGLPIWATIEWVSPFAKANTRSSFTFGANYGFLRGLLVAHGIAFQTVKPQNWLRGLNLRTKQKDETQREWKTYLLECAQNMFPDWEFPKTKGDRFAVADAILIAEYSRRSWGKFNAS